MTVLPRDLTPSTLASVNGWAVTAKSTQADAALALGQYLSDRAVHSGWTSIQPPPADADEDTPAVVCHQALSRAVVPRVDSNTVRTAVFLDQQLNALAHNPAQTPEALYAKIQAHLQAPSSPAGVHAGSSSGGEALPPPKVEASAQVRGL
jgi:hypothetical protein